MPVVAECRVGAVFDDKDVEVLHETKQVYSAFTAQCFSGWIGKVRNNISQF